MAQKWSAQNPATKPLTGVEYWAAVQAGSATPAVEISVNDIKAHLQGTPIFIVTTGQSNFVREMPMAWQPAPNLFVWNNLQDVNGNVGNAFVAPNAASMNLTRKFASDIAYANPTRPVYLVNMSISGVAIAKWLIGAVGPAMWTNLINNVVPALAVAGVTQISMFAWAQGNADQSTITEYNYSTTFETVITQLVAQTWFPIKTPVILVGLGSAADTGFIAYDRFNDILKFLARTETRLYVEPSTFPGPIYFDATLPAHLTAAGYSMVGSLMANEVLGAARSPKVPAVAVDALAMTKGLQTNGSSIISQENGANVVAFGAGTFSRLTDGWLGIMSGASASGQQVATPFPTRPDIPFGLKINITAAKPVLAAGDFGALFHQIESTRMLGLGFGSSAAIPLSFGFMARSSVAFTGYICLRSSNTDRHFLRRYTLAADTDTWINLTIPGCPDGTWGIGIAGGQLRFSLADGSSFQGGPSDTWDATGFITGLDQTNLGAALNNNIIISGLLILPGLYLPSADHAGRVIRPEQEELVMCQRYIEKTYDLGILPGALNAFNEECYESTIAGGGTFSAIGDHTRFRVKKAKTPTAINTYSPATGLLGKARDLVALADVNAAVDHIGTDGFRWQAPLSVPNAHASIAMHWLAIAAL